MENNNAFCIHVIKGLRKYTARGGNRGTKGAPEMKADGTCGVLRTGK